MTGTAEHATLLRGWKEIAAELKVCVDTAKAKHRARPMPLSRDNPRDWPFILVEDLERWLREGRETRRT